MTRLARQSLACVAFLLCSATAAWACPDPGWTQIVIDSDANFGGSCTVLEVGSYPNAATMGLPNDSVDIYLKHYNQY